MRFEIPFYGHENVRALHPRTIEITTETDLTLQGDCIVGINAGCGCNGIPEELKQKIQEKDAKITITITVNKESFTVIGHGHPDLKLENPHDIVIRTSDYLCPRTLAVGCDFASNDIPRNIIRLLRDPKTKGMFVIEVT